MLTRLSYLVLGTSLTSPPTQTIRTHLSTVAARRDMVEFDIVYDLYKIEFVADASSCF